jgi:hypothetical protein
VSRGRRKSELVVSGSLKLRYVEVTSNGVTTSRLDIEGELRSAMGLAPVAKNQLSLAIAPASTSASSAHPPRVESTPAPARVSATTRSKR